MPELRRKRRAARRLVVAQAACLCHDYANSPATGLPALAGRVARRRRAASPAARPAREQRRPEVLRRHRVVLDVAAVLVATRRTPARRARRPRPAAPSSTPASGRGPARSTTFGVRPNSPTITTSVSSSRPRTSRSSSRAETRLVDARQRPAQAEAARCRRCCPGRPRRRACPSVCTLRNFSPGGVPAQAVTLTSRTPASISRRAMQQVLSERVPAVAVAHGGRARGPGRTPAAPPARSPDRRPAPGSGACRSAGCAGRDSSRLSRSLPAAAGVRAGTSGGGSKRLEAEGRGRRVVEVGADAQRGVRRRRGSRR